MKGGKRRSSVDPPPATAEHAANKCPPPEPTTNGIPPVLESPAGEVKRPKYLAKAAAGSAAGGAGDDEEEREDGSEDYEDEEEEEDEKGYDQSNELENEDEEALAGAGEDGQERPKLAEGFYEIEAVRKKRVRKGQLQYLIKWRGWPETANTWEPFDNLTSCSDIIDAFEERSGKRSSRKRKRKYGGSQSQTRKKQHMRSPADATHDAPAVRVRIIEESSPTAPHADTAAQNHAGNSFNGITDAETAKELNENGVKFAPSRVERTEVRNHAKATPEKESLADQSTGLPQEAHVAGLGAVANGSENTESTETFQLGRSTGARRRKSGSVKRFKQEPNSSSFDAASSGVLSGSDGNQLPQNPDLKSNDLGSKNKTNNSKNICDITEIIRPISYSSTISSDTQDVSVTFMAKRADGKEVTVDNKFLKSNNPVLLIDFYEQHLRYTVG